MHHMDQDSAARNVLHRVLADATFPGAEELRSQIAGLSVTDGPVTMLDLAVTGTRSPRPDGPVPVRAIVVGPGQDSTGEVLVWVTGGYLSTLEYAWYTDEPPQHLPLPGDIRIEPDDSS